jgi:hypothetical protein
MLLGCLLRPAVVSAGSLFLKEIEVSTSDGTNLTVPKQLIKLALAKQWTFPFELGAQSGQPHFAVPRVFERRCVAVVGRLIA